MRRDYVFPDSPATFTVLADRDKAGPHGLDGGLPGKKASYIFNPDGENRELNSKSTFELLPGDVVSYRTAGGGGYGSPFERDPALVQRDVRDEKVSRERAESEYGVVIGADGAVDEAGTTRLRSS